MRNLDGKFGIDGDRIVNLVSGEAIPDDEPVFLFRARDRYAAQRLQEYLEVCIRFGCEQSHLNSVQVAVDKFRDFRAKYQERMKKPGSTGDVKPEVKA